MMTETPRHVGQDRTVTVFAADGSEDGTVTLPAHIFDATVTLSPAERCPAYSVPDDIAAAIREKQRRDDVEIADLINRGIPPAPITTRVDGGTNPAFLAEAK